MKTYCIRIISILSEYSAPVRNGPPHIPEPADNLLQQFPSLIRDSDFLVLAESLGQVNCRDF